MENKPVITQQPGLPEDPKTTVPINGGYVLKPAPDVTWMPRPLSIQGVPNGLDQLTDVDRIQIYQIRGPMEITTDYEIDRKYVLVNSKMEQIYYGLTEMTKCCEGCDQNGKLVIHVLDSDKTEVLIIKRPYKGCCLGFCQQECTVESPILGLLSTTRYKQECLFYQLDVENEDGNLDFHVLSTGVCEIIRCQEKKFTIKSNKSNEIIGKITEKLDKELFENSPKKLGQFFVNFPMDLDVKQKGALLGATFFAVHLQYQQDLSLGLY